MNKDEMMQLFEQNVRAIFYFKKPTTDIIIEIKELMSRAYDIGFMAGTSEGLSISTNTLKDALDAVSSSRLHWNDYPALDETSAKTSFPFGRYFIGTDSRMSKYGVFWHNENDEERYHKPCNTIDEGKEIAQKDWEKRQKTSCL